MPAEKKETFCICCGLPKARREMGLTAVDQRAPIWQMCTFANVTLHFCSKCWTEREGWLKDGIRGASEREEAQLRNGVKLATGDFT